MIRNSTTVTVGSGKSIHWGSDCGTICGAAHRNGFFTAPKTVKAETASCKRCIRIAAAHAEEAHAEALLVEEIETARTEAKNEDAQRTWDAERAEDLAAPSVAFPAAVALDTWLTKGLVLVSPSTDSLLVFERWDGGTAVLLSAVTGDTVRIAQADIVNWRYLPGMDATDAQLAEEARDEATPAGHAARHHAATSCEQGDACPFPHAVRVRVGDVIEFVPGVVRTVSEVEHHEGTDLYSFSVEGYVHQFVRHATEQVRRLSPVSVAR